MVPAGNKAKCLLPVNHTTKTIHYHHHHHHHPPFDTIIILIGDSIAAGLSCYSNVCETFFKGSPKLGIGGNRSQHILRLVKRLPFPSHLKYVIIHCGTNVEYAIEYAIVEFDVEC